MNPSILETTETASDQNNLIMIYNIKGLGDRITPIQQAIHHPQPYICDLLYSRAPQGKSRSIK